MAPLVTLAQLAVESFVRKGRMISVPENLPQEFLKKKAGTFVTIKKAGSLRGCIGTYLPTKENIAKEIIQNAIAAATEDYRFGPIQKEELSSLSYTVYILSRPELINPHATKRIISFLRRRRQSSFSVGVKDISELNPKKYGIIVKTTPINFLKRGDVVFNGSLPYKSGLLLPDLEGIETSDQQILIACQKGGIDPIRENIIIYKFEVEKYK
jgi:uncharacterized protein (TIGR00296 family)